MDEAAVQIVSRGPRLEAETAAEAIDADVRLEGATYSILEEDEDKGIWRIDAFPTSDEERAALEEVLAGFPALTT
ncbi:MAG: 50S ribosomal protein L11 methyltransferase, partial [Pseudomonadota bacterium]|nr:50S ribosomal protein L11 methyltransferase [Pseudomonadota bacterium]